MTALVEWKVFCQWVREHGEDKLPVHVSLPELNRFSVRYRLANSFEGLVLHGYADETEAAYSALMKAFWAYSAFEQFDKAVKAVPKIHRTERWAELATGPAAELRAAEEIVDFLAKQMDYQNTQKRVISFRDGETDNCLIVAAALRHAVAHGFMSVHPHGSSAKTAAIFCERVSAMLMTISHQAFVDFTQELPEYASTAKVMVAESR